MRRLLGAALLGLVVACAPGQGRTQADVERDGRTLADAIHAADLEGSGFSMQQAFVLTGGEIPAGQEIRLEAGATDGVMKDGAARFTYRTQQAGRRTEYDVVVHDLQLFVKRRGAPDWKVAALPAATSLLPVLRLEVLREVVLLASSIGSATVARVDAGIARKYVVRPAPDQLEQLHSVSVQGQAEREFLRTAAAELSVFLTVPGNRLGRLEVRLTGTDPADGTKQVIDNGLDLRSAKVGAIRPPDRAQLVDPSELLT